MTSNYFEPFTARPDRQITADGRVSIRPAQQCDARFLAAITWQREGGEYAGRLQRFTEEIEKHSGSDERVLMSALHCGFPVAFGKVITFKHPPNAPANIAPEGFYLGGLIVTPGFRRMGIGRQLTVARLEWLRERASEVYYFVNARNLASIALHEEFGFVEVTRDFSVPGVEFSGGEGILYSKSFR